MGRPVGVEIGVARVGSRGGRLAPLAWALTLCAVVGVGLAARPAAPVATSTGSPSGAAAIAAAASLPGVRSPRPWPRWAWRTPAPRPSHREAGTDGLMGWFGPPLPQPPPPSAGQAGPLTEARQYRVGTLPWQVNPSQR